jgi:hypothetical protein
MPLTDDGSSQPFDAAITLVSGINDVVSALNSPDLEHPLSDVIDLLGDLIETLGMIPYIDDAWDLIDAACNAIGGLVDALTAFTEVIPGLDVVVDVLDSIVNLIDGLEDAVDGVLDAVIAVVNDILPILRDIHTGLSDVQNLIKDMAGELPALINTMKILQALAEIVQAIAPLFKDMADGSSVTKRLEAVLSAYEAVDAQITKAAQPLVTAFDAVKPVLTTLGELAKELNSIGDGAFATIESDFKWVADKVSDAEKTAKSIAMSLAPVHWVLKAVSSVVDKVIKPVLKKIEKISGISELEESLVGLIEQKLGIAAIEQFKTTNGSGKSGAPKKTDAFGGNQKVSGSKNAGTLKTLWGDVGAALQDYKRGDKTSAVETAVEALVDAITGGEIDLNAMPPLIQKKTVKLYIPSVTATPDKAALAAQADGLRLGAAARASARRPIHAAALAAAADPLPMAQAQAVVQLAQTLTGDLKAPLQSLGDLNTAATAAIAALTTAAPGIAPATGVLSQISSYTGAPPRALVEIGAIATIATTINDVVTRLNQLYPSETQMLAKAAPDLQDLTKRLNALAANEAAISQVLAGADAQVRTTLVQINAITRLPAHANAIAGVAASGASVLQLLSMLEALNVTLGNAYDQGLAQVQATLSAGATAQAAVFNGLVKEVAGLGPSLQSVQSTGGDVLAYYEGVAQWGAPVSAQWLPMLIDGANYAKAIDSILTPLSYLLQAGGCASPAAPRQLGSVADTIRQSALAAATFMRDAAIAALSKIMAALPDVLEKVTADALNLSQMEALVAGAQTSLANDLAALVQVTGEIQGTLATIDTTLATIENISAPTPQSYSCTYTDAKGKQQTITVSNAFFTTADARSITTLANTMINAANGKGLPLPAAPPIVQT